MQRIAKWLREASNEDHHDKLVARCHLAANVVDDLEKRLRSTEDELLQVQRELFFLKAVKPSPLLKRIWGWGG